MINRIPDYLKLFIEDVEEPTNKASAPEFKRLCSIFPEATGLRLEVSENDSNQLTFPWSDSKVISYRVSLQPTKRSNLQSLSAAKELEEALASLLSSYGETRNQLRDREAELATAVPVVSVDEDGEHLAERLDSVLRGVADMLQCYGAGLYLLDEGTASLKLRAHAGLTEDAFLKPARRLEDAIADVEALAGRAVVIEDTRTQSQWRVPETSKSAMCVPISSATTILGTLWLYRDFAQDFTPTEQNLAEITAGRLVSDLERAVLTREVRTLRGKDRPAEHDDNWAEGRLNRLAPMVDGWDIADSRTNTKIIGDFCHWHVADDDRMHLAVGAAHGVTNKQLSSVAFQSAHAAHITHNPSVAKVFDLANQSQWTSSIEGDRSSLFHAVLDPTCGSLQYGLAGGVFAYVLRPHGWEPLLASRAVLGIDCEVGIDVHRQMLMPGDILVAMSCPMPDRQFDQDNRMNQVAEKLLHNTHLSAIELADLATSQLKSMDVSGDSHAVLVAKREG